MILLLDKNSPPLSPSLFKEREPRGEFIMTKKKEIIALARSLRKSMTRSERVLWEILRNRKLDGKKFLRQHPVIFGFSPVRNHYSFVIVDFYYAEGKLVIEVDGSIHDVQEEYDEQRTKLLQEIGLKVIRIKNCELEDIEKVKQRIREELTPRSPLSF